MRERTGDLGRVEPRSQREGINQNGRGLLLPPMAIPAIAPELSTAGESQYS